jgi:diguanylate cyclase (GGDEF)-like protein
VLDLGGAKLVVGYTPELYGETGASRGKLQHTRPLSGRLAPDSQEAAPHPVMLIDSFTVLLFGLLIKLLLGGLFIVFWMKTRNAAWFAWWAASLFLGVVTSIMFMLRAAASDNFLTIGVGNGSLLAALVCCWQGARAFERRRPIWAAVVLTPLLWVAACSVPVFLDAVHYRIALASCIAAPLLALCGFEFWRGRAEELPSRWPIVAIFASFALFMAARIPLMWSTPFPFGALPMQPGWLGAFNLVMFAHTLLLTVLIVAMSKERLELDQRTKAQTDPLTGSLNRRAFMLRGERLLKRHAYERAPLCLLFLDLDHFKSLNDRLGHSGGDDVLTGFVNLVNACIRPTDLLFRIGGEEFCCLLPHTTTEQAHRVAERIRHQFETLRIAVAGTQVRATASLGIASTDAFGYQLDTLMRRADMAVYAAKRAGRNRVTVATPGEPEDDAACRMGEAVTVS